MPVRVVNVRTAEPGTYLYVGRHAPGLKGHPLANPYKLRRGATVHEREGCLKRYIEWLDKEDKERAILVLAGEVLAFSLPLGCWCCDWDGVSEPAPLCHAVVLAKRVQEILGEQSC